MIYKGLLVEINYICPYTFMKVKKNRPAWFSGHLRSVSMERDRLFNCYRISGRKNKNIYVEAVKKRREFHALVKDAKKTYFKEQLIKNRGDQNKFWETMHNLLGNKNSISIERVFKYGTEELLSLQNSVNEINEFFATVGDRVEVSTCNEHFVQYDPPGSCLLTTFTLFTCESSLEILGELSVHKSSGIQDLPTSLLFDAIRAVPEIFV